MDSYEAALGRQCGKLTADSSGLARYSLTIEVPPGIGHGNEPELSLEYCQGCPNGSLGLGWALGGLSCIRYGPSSMAWDGANTPPPGYNRFQPKLTLDGVELIDINGKYGVTGTEYTTEIDNLGKTVTQLTTGFLVSDSTGRKWEYGTTSDSQVIFPGGTKVTEWWLKTQSDYHGNTVTFTYISSPQQTASQTGGGSADIQTCYLSEVRYSSNDSAGHPATRIVQLDYSSRSDQVVQSIGGDRTVWGSLLSAIHIGVIQGAVIRVDRSYQLAYTLSSSTGDSCLTSVTETANKDGKKVELIPSTFGYTSPGVSPQDLFNTVPQTVTRLTETQDNVALFTLNTSGRCLADLACVRYDSLGSTMSIKTYLAARKSDGTITWAPSTGPGAEASLPPMDLSNGFPDILSPDLSGDGRSDLVIPYADSNGNIRFSISESVGTGFLDSQTKETSCSWTEDSKFMAVDLTGHGTPDIVQIFTGDSQKLAFRNFSSYSQDGKIAFQDAKLSSTQYDNVDTIDWLTFTHAKTGAMSLVRVWTKDQGMGTRSIMATAFDSASDQNSNSGFQEGKTSVLESSVPVNKTKYNVVACDINGDETQDIVLATVLWQDPQMTLAYTTFLGDGDGGFEKYQDTITRQISSPSPRGSEDFGQFHATNLNGSNYPSVSFVYQALETKAYVCLSVDGQCNGLASNVTLYPIDESMPASKMDIIAADLNGNGMGDWLFYTLDDDSPRVVPIYNRAAATDLLSWARNPVGLLTNVTYGSLADPCVYTPSVSWEDYRNDSKTSYPVLGAPNYVVTGLEHSNDSSINSFDYKLLIKRTYNSAVVNTMGRGWQGFGSINTLNVTDSILTTEEYFQTWPITSFRSQIDTGMCNGAVLKSQKATYESKSTSRGPWNIYHTNKTLDQTDMLDNGVVTRSNSTTYMHDDLGNVTNLASSETVQGQVAFQAWQTCTYTTINGITGLLAGKKISSKQGNIDMSKFEEGDSSLIHIDYDPVKATMKSISEWSTDIGAFAVKTFTFDEYGNEAQTVDASGLITTTSYDTFFQSFPVKVTNTGPGISKTQLTAFDQVNGQPCAKIEENGSLICHRFDQFDRLVETQLKSCDQGEASVAASDFLINSYVSDASFTKAIGNLRLNPYRKISYERQKGASGSAYMGIKVLSYSKSGDDGQSEVFELMDCSQQVRRRCTQHGDSTSITWMAWEYDSLGNHTFQAFPTQISGSIDLDWAPDMANGVKATFDTLGRTTTKARPSHGDGDHFIAETMTYLDGGSRIQHATLSSPSVEVNLPKSTQLALVEKSYVRIGQEEHVKQVIDENKLTSTFQYDVAGNMTLATDPAGNQERRTYNSRGQLTSLDNVYQNVDAVAVVAMTYKYNASGHLVSQVNANNELVKWERDAMGRPVQKMGHDGRTICYSYEAEGVDKPSSIIVYPDYTQGSKSALECRFDFTFDACGRTQTSKWTLADESILTTSVNYDWQGEVVQKVFPDGTILSNNYRGALMESSSLSGGSSTMWLLEADIAEYNANESPEKIVVRGTGIKSDFEHDWTYDSQGFPLSHSLGSGKTSLVQDHYTYNDLDQITQRHESISGLTTTYSYSGKRLGSSQCGDGPANIYTYDEAGNLTTKQGINITCSPGRAVGTSTDNAYVYDVLYDASGRMIKRSTEKSTFSFTYDSFGALKSYSTVSSGVSATCNIITDYEGETLQRNHPDGSSDLMISPDFNIHTQPDGSMIARHKLFSKGYMLGTVSNTYECSSSTQSLGGEIRTVDVSFTDTKGNVTHVFDGQAGTLLQQLEYDDYGALISNVPNDKDQTSTYEGNQLDVATGLLDFGGRWYDPLVGRFTTPDDILNVDLLARTDGLNRYTFENSDPVNHTDPTGHWSWCSIAGICVGAVLITGAIALTVATGGAAGVLAGAAVGALAGGGVAGIAYSIQHKNEENAAKLWGGFGTTVAINAAIGAATGAFGSVATPARTLAATGRLASKVGLDLAPKSIAFVGRLASLGGKSLVCAAGTVFSQATDRGVNNAFYGTHYDLFAGAGSTFAEAAVMGMIVGGMKGGSIASGQTSSAGEQGAFKLRAFTGLRSVLAPKPTNPWAMPGITKQIMSATWKNAKSLYHATGLEAQVNTDLKAFRSSFEKVNGF